MPLNLANISLYGSKSGRGSSLNTIPAGPTVINIDNVASNSATVQVNTNTSTTIIINRPADAYFDSQNTWHLYIESQYKESYTHKILLAFHQGASSWIGKKCEVHFISINAGIKTTQKVTTISNFSDQYYEHIVAVDNVGTYTILQQSWAVV